MIRVERKSGGLAHLLDPWGSGSLAAFTIITALLSIYGFATGWNLPL